MSTLEFLGITPEKAGIDPDVFKAGLQQLNSDPNMMLAFMQQFHDGKEDVCRGLAKEYAQKVEPKPNEPVFPM
jgi:hypothetical protein